MQINGQQEWVNGGIVIIVIVHSFCGASAEVLLFVLAANTWKVFNCCMGKKNRCVLLLWCSPNLLEDSCVVTRHGLHLKPFDVVSLKTYIVESLCKSCGKTAAGISKETVGHDLYHQAVNVKIILTL